tara:strand:+ start:2829 stop:3041 length:213 start_codon:yes stop_codon:yes gene_type:complete
MSKENDSEFKQIIVNQTNHIIELQEELIKYKQFHDAIINHEEIKKKFLKYENTIDKLVSKNTYLQELLNK